MTYLSLFYSKECIENGCGDGEERAALGGGVLEAAVGVAAVAVDEVPVVALLAAVDDAVAHDWGAGGLHRHAGLPAPHTPIALARLIVAEPNTIISNYKIKNKLN